MQIAMTEREMKEQEQLLEDFATQERQELIARFGDRVPEGRLELARFAIVRALNLLRNGAPTLAEEVLEKSLVN